MNRRSRMIALIGLASVGLGCAPSEFGPAEAYYAERHHVRDAAARHATSYWFLRFDELAISDLDDAIEAGRAGNAERMRRLAEQVLRAASSIACASGQGEIDRMPESGRRELADLADCPADAARLKEAYATRCQAALVDLLARHAELSNTTLCRELEQIHRAIEPAPDDQGRLARQILFAWAAAPAWMGVNKIDDAHESKPPATESDSIGRAAVWSPKSNGDADPFVSFAPTIAIEWPEARDYPADYDRFGEVYLSGSTDDIHVHVNATRPVLYTYHSEAKINGRRHRQLVYVWWFSDRPAMTDDDPAAGHIDGDTLRITLGSDGRPAVFEVLQSCGCGHLVYVADDVERRAREQFGGPLPDKTLAVERNVAGKRDLYVSGTVPVPDAHVRPVVFIQAGFHEVSGLRCMSASAPTDAETVEEHAYSLVPYSRLEQLPLGEGVASMFGPDGLVHNAGRTEGYLLAPTGILSAGQPRKRGTQKIRWDDYSFEDPRLLEKTLRLPDDF